MLARRQPVDRYAEDDRDLAHRLDRREFAQSLLDETAVPGVQIGRRVHVHEAQTLALASLPDACCEVSHLRYVRITRYVRSARRSHPAVVTNYLDGATFHLVKTALETRIDEVILTRKTFADAKAWCKAAGISEGYLGTLKSRLRAGKATGGKAQKIQALARVAGVSVEWLMGLSSNTAGEDPLFDDFLKEIQLRPGLWQALQDAPRRYHTLTVVRALQVVPSTQAGSGVPSVGWPQLLNDIERGRNEPTTGDARAVGVAAAKQVGKRPKLP